MYASDEQKTPGRKLLLAILVGVALAIPIFMVWALVYDRQTRSDEARASITEAICDSSTASGFSTSTCLPASAARIAHSTCWLVGSGI